MRWVLAAFYVAAGIAHLMAPEGAARDHAVLGAVRAAGDFCHRPVRARRRTGLVTRPLRWWAGVALAAYALCVWPANFKHAIDGIDLPHIYQQLVLSRASVGVSAGPDLVGAVCRRGHRLAVAARAISDGRRRMAV